MTALQYIIAALFIIAFGLTVAWIVLYCYAEYHRGKVVELTKALHSLPDYDEPQLYDEEENEAESPREAKPRYPKK